MVSQDFRDGTNNATYFKIAFRIDIPCNWYRVLTLFNKQPIWKQLKQQHYLLLTLLFQIFMHKIARFIKLKSIKIARPWRLSLCVKIASNKCVNNSGRHRLIPKWPDYFTNAILCSKTYVIEGWVEYVFYPPPSFVRPNL